MRLRNDRVFERQYKKLPRALKEKVNRRLALFIVDEFNPLLNNHKLEPPYDGYRSINITGDLRLVYKRIEPDIYYLRAVGTHNQLYGT